jgi:PAS domain S-box-containing protein
MMSHMPQNNYNAVDSATLLLDLLPTMAWTATPDGMVDFVNRQFCAFTGLSRERLLGHGVAETLHPEDRERRPQMLSDLAGRRSFEAEVRIRRHDGEYTRCVARAAALCDAEGRVIKWVGTTIEVEEMRHTTERLIQEQHLQLALESADVGIWRLKLPSYDLTVDERTRRHLDLPTHSISGYRPEDFIHPQDWPRSASAEPEPNGRFFTEHRVRQRDGTYRWQAIAWRSWCEDDSGEPTLITGISMDVTARKQAEAEREELWQRYRIALAAADLGTFTCDLDARTVQLDERAQAHLAVAQGTLSFEDCVAGIEPADFERGKQETLRRMQSPDSSSAAIEFRVRRKNGEVRWIATQLQVTFSDKGSPQRIFGVIRDITETKRTEAKLRRLHADLERRVQQRTAELAAANAELESFAYTVAHDLRAPLRAMSGFCHVLIEDFGSHLPPEARRYLQHVTDGSKHLANIIDGLLVLSRSTRGELRRDVVDLSLLAEQKLRELARLEPDRRVIWHIQSGLRATGDARMLESVIANLLSNAWKYSGHREEAIIGVYRAVIDGEPMFCIEDNGVGFDMAHSNKLFQPFQRLHRQDEFQGLGIGLATVQRIVHRHGGRVSAVGVPGKGAVFRFSLPQPDEAGIAVRKLEKAG